MSEAPVFPPDGTASFGNRLPQNVTAHGNKLDNVNTLRSFIQEKEIKLFTLILSQSF